MYPIYYDVMNLNFNFLNFNLIIFYDVMNLNFKLKLLCLLYNLLLNFLKKKDFRS